MSSAETSFDEPQNLVGGLSAEIERVRLKQERWHGYCRDNPALASGMSMGLMLMDAELKEARAALNSGDVLRMMPALERLREYDDND